MRGVRGVRGIIEDLILLDSLVYLTSPKHRCSEEPPYDVYCSRCDTRRDAQRPVWERHIEIT